VVRRIGSQRPDLMVIPSGGMWGPVKNDHHVQARSKENQTPIVFVHPIEFLVTGPQGEILDRRFTSPYMDAPVGGAGEDSLICEVEIRLPSL
jgi:hypothetical protein